LRKRGLVIIDIARQRKTALTTILSLFSRVGLVQVAGFTRQLATMVNAGLPLTQALTLIKDQAEPKMTSMIGEILDAVEGGGTLSGVLEKYEKVFGTVYVTSIKAGEEAGVLEKVLLRLADNLEKTKEFLGKVKSAMIYPVIVLVGMGGVIFIVMTFVVPKLTALYSEFGSEMPLPTRILMSISGVFSRFFWLFPIVGFGAIVGFKLMMAKKKYRMKVDRWKLKLPIIGPLLKAVILTEITRTMAMLVQTGVPLIDALSIVSKSAGNEIYQQSFEKATTRVEKGFPFSEAIAEEPEFPPIVAQMISTGEETGKLDEILFNLSRYFEAEAEQKVKGLTSAIEPLIMIVLGVGVALLVFAVIMPIYDLTSQF